MEPEHKDVSSVIEADEIEALFIQTKHNVSFGGGYAPADRHRDRRDDRWDRRR